MCALPTIYSDQCRRASIPKEHGARFVYDTGAGMHVTVATDTKEDKLKAQREKHRVDLDEVFCNSRISFRYSVLLKQIMDSLSMSKRTAERRIDTWTKLRLIEKNTSEDYVRI
jgi:hypothetical protein